MGLEVFGKHGPARAEALADYVDYAMTNDLFLTYVIVNPQADRSKSWGEQAEELVAQIVDEDSTGLTIRGAKMLGTSSIMANEVFVANLQPLKPGEEAIAFSCALPMNAPGLRVLSRKSYEAHAVSVYDNPLSARFDENDALLYFDNVNYQSQIRLSVKLKFLVGLAHKITEAIGTTNMPQVREQLGTLAADAGMVEGMLSGMEASGGKHGEFYLPNRHLMYSAQAVTQELYPRLINLIRDLAGGSLIMLPSSSRDWANPELAPILRKTQRSSSFTPEEKVKLLKAAWDAIGSEFGSRHTQYEMFYAGARFVVSGHSYRTFDWGAARGMVDHLLSTYDIAETLKSAAE
jgi:4-hydroxyphenylacetate 3-monooxygenase